MMPRWLSRGMERQDLAPGIESSYGARALRRPRPGWASRGYRLVVGMLALILLLAWPGATALAHGGGVAQLVEEAAGPYHMYAWTNPNPARVGTVHVTVALADPENQAPILNADVEVRFEPLDLEDSESGAETVTARATHTEAANKITYETDLEVAASGRWQVVILARSPEGRGQSAFDLEVRPRAFSNWLLVGGVGLAVVAAGWLFWPNKPRANQEHTNSQSNAHGGPTTVRVGLGPEDD